MNEPLSQQTERVRIKADAAVTTPSGTVGVRKVSLGSPPHSLSRKEIFMRTRYSVISPFFATTS